MATVHFSPPLPRHCPPLPTTAELRYSLARIHSLLTLRPTPNGDNPHPKARLLARAAAAAAAAVAAVVTVAATALEVVEVTEAVTAVTAVTAVEVMEVTEAAEVEAPRTRL